MSGSVPIYRTFLGGFSHIAVSLHALTKKNRPFVWDAACQHAFDDLKERLVSAQVLGLPSDDGLFVLDTDASEVATGVSSISCARWGRTGYSLL